MDDFYDRQTNDFQITKGDTENLCFELYDEDTGEALDITSLECQFNVYDPYTHENISALSKSHNDAVTGGDGIFFYGDTQKPTELTIVQNNQMVIVLDVTDTNELDFGVYLFDVEFDNGAAKKTPIKGHLIVEKEVTPSVS